MAVTGRLQPQWPVPHSPTAPAPAPTTNQSALRCKRCQNVPPLAVATAASRSRARAVNFVALSVAFCFAAAGICAEGASGEILLVRWFGERRRFGCWRCVCRRCGRRVRRRRAALLHDAGSYLGLNSSLLYSGRCALRRIKRDGLRERKKFWQIPQDLSRSLSLSLQRVDLSERVLQCGRAIVFTNVGGTERLFLRRDRRLQSETIVMLCEPCVECHSGQKHGEKNA